LIVELDRDQALAGVAAVRVVLPLPGEEEPLGANDVVKAAVYRVHLADHVHAEAEAPAGPRLENERLHPNGARRREPHLGRGRIDPGPKHSFT
jgi:hypothetical protein